MLREFIVRMRGVHTILPERKTPPNLVIFNLSFAHFAVGMLSFLFAMIMAIWLAPNQAVQGTFRTQDGWLLAHILLLGFASMIAIGASYQITQVIMRTNLYSRTLGWIQYAFYLAGLLLILTGFSVNAKLIAPGGSLLVMAIVIYTLNILITFIRKREWNPFVLGVGLSVISFLFTGILGTLIGMQMAYRWGTLQYDSLFVSHLWMGIGGWLSGLILVFSFKLLPMFYVSARKVSASAYWIISGFHLGIWVKLVAIWSRNEWLNAIAYIVIVIMIGMFVWFGFQVRQERRAKQPIGAVRIALYVLPINGLIFAVWCGVSWMGIGTSRYTEALIALLVIGWFAPTILSYLSKILPFLWWAHRYRTREEKKGAVLLANMLPEARLTWELIGYLAGAFAAIGGFVCGMPWLVAVGLIGAVVFTIVYMVELMRVFKY